MSNEANQKEKIQLYRTAAFSYLGVAHYNYNSILGARRIYEQAVLDKQEETMAEVQEIIEKVKELATDSVKIATFAEQLVKDNPRLASSLEFMLGVELQEKARREEDASKV
tara:strand:+ start:405 stop:737 length:333 start_codon:yes stop_codon:yes gene_type:complete